MEDNVNMEGNPYKQTEEKKKDFLKETLHLMLWTFVGVAATQLLGRIVFMAEERAGETLTNLIFNQKRFKSTTNPNAPQQPYSSNPYNRQNSLFNSSDTPSSWNNGNPFK